MTEKQDFASRTFLKEDGTEVNANGVAVGSPEEQLQQFTDLESLRQKVRDLTDENDQLKAQAPAEPDQELLNELAQVKTERNTLAAQARSQADIISHGSADNARLIEQAGSATDNSFRLKAELDSLSGERDALKARIFELEQAQQNATAQQLAVPEGAVLLPADARDRLIGVKGVGEKLADEILSALAPASEAQS